MKFARSQRAIEEFLRSLFAHRVAQAARVVRCRTLRNPFENIFLGFRERTRVQPPNAIVGLRFASSNRAPSRAQKSR